MPAVRELQAALTLDADRAGGAACPSPTRRRPTSCSSSRSCASGCRRSRPPQRDREYQQRFAPLGLLAPELAVRRSRSRAGRRPAPGLAQGSETRAGAHQGSESRAERLEAHLPRLRLQPGLLRGRGARRPAWKLPDGPTRYVERALAARGGLWGNHGYEAAYAMVYDDGDGERSTVPPLRAALRDRPARRRVLVGDDVRRCPTSTSSPTRSTATRSATARPA